MCVREEEPLRAQVTTHGEQPRRVGLLGRRERQALVEPIDRHAIGSVRSYASIFHRGGAAEVGARDSRGFGSALRAAGARDGELHGEGGALPGGALDVERAAERLDELRNDVQAEA